MFRALARGVVSVLAVANLQVFINRLRVLCYQVYNNPDPYTYAVLQQEIETHIRSAFSTVPTSQYDELARILMSAVASSPVDTTELRALGPQECANQHPLIAPVIYNIADILMPGWANNTGYFVYPQLAQAPQPPLWPQTLQAPQLPPRPQIQQTPQLPQAPQISQPPQLPPRRKPPSPPQPPPPRNATHAPPSEAKDEWEDQKVFEGAQNDALDELMTMIGLEDVKRQFLEIKIKIDIAARQGVDVKRERFGAALLGNPGTGKTTVARLYARFLTSVGVLPGRAFVETSGSRLANGGVSGCQKEIEDISNAGGGALFIDEAYQLSSQSQLAGAHVLDFLVAEIENQAGKVVVIVAGYTKQMEAFFAYNPGLPSRFPRQIQFRDYEDTELLEILAQGIEKRYGARMQVERGLRGLYSRIVARRIGRARGREGFGNARAVESVLAHILERQAKRIRAERRAGKRPDDLLLTRDDLLGPKPANALENSSSWSKLQTLIGLRAVKESLKAMFNSVQRNYSRELSEEPLIEYTLNKAFLGSPGTGKTTVAKLYGHILADLGLLSNGEVVLKTPADFVGSVLGASEENTKRILASAVGKVLVIDEAYGLYGGSTADPYKTAVIDTIVGEVQSTPGDDRCVLLVGYKEQMEEMYQNVNPGLSRRFPLNSAFIFEDFTDAELKLVLDMKLRQQGFQATEEAKKVALEMLSRARDHLHFGNAGEVENLLNDAKRRYEKRPENEDPSASALLVPCDFDPDFDRGARAVINVTKLFEGVIGCDDIVAKLQGYQVTVANMRARGMDPREEIPFAFLFRGPPGTGKTSTARRMGKIYYDMGFLATTEVIECSATDLIGEYIGQTGPRTRKLFESALGKVLFIDEAYRLGEGQFAQEAMDEMVDCLTKPKFAQKLVVILAGYDADINRLMLTNPGLTSRFPETIVFEGMKPGECVELFALLLKKRKQVDIKVLDPPSTELRDKMLKAFETLSSLTNWASARDIETLVKNVFGSTIRDAPPSSQSLVVGEQAILEELSTMIRERLRRTQDVASPSWLNSAQGAYPLHRFPQPPSTNFGSFPNPNLFQRNTVAKNISQTEHQTTIRSPGNSENESTRDPGVSNATWQQLQNDIAQAKAKEMEFARIVQKEEELRKSILRMRQVEQGNECDQAESGAKNEHKQQIVQNQLIRRAAEHELVQIERKKHEMERQRQLETLAQARLKTMGVCCMGFSWIRQATGYRCAGGSHFVSNAQLGL